MKKVTYGLIAIGVLIIVAIGLLLVNNSPESSINETAYPLDAVKGHNAAEDCWVLYNGNVYDITSFLSEHKSGLEEYCGTSEEFEEAYSGTHGSSKDYILEDYKIGVVE
tara:strand:+ start:21102 stop:21428 length:327 start_codon:yes stop_codon:yes gene_type:complete